MTGTEDTQLALGLAETMASFPEVEAGDARPPPGFPSGPERYEPADVLGRGGMGTVYVARDAQFGREIALKEIGGEALTTEGVRRFLVEALVTANLEHPGIPAVYERGVRDGKPFYAMRKVQGHTLGQAIAEARTFDERLALLPSIVQVAHTLGFAHERGVVHRDVKPDNVIQGDHGETVLLDWGIARVRAVDFADGVGPSPVELEGNATVAGHVMGTPAYMAPEQAAGRVDQIDERTDVFALGAILYHVLSGAAPYEGPTGAAVLTAALESTRAPIARAAPKTPAALREIVDTAMAAAPEERYPNAGAFADALQDFLTSKVRERSSPLIRALGTVVGLAMLVLTVAVGTQFIGMISSFEEQGSAAYSYVLFTVLSVVLAAVEWRTKGRNHLAPLVLGFAIVTVLAGIAGTLSGLGVVVQAARQVPEDQVTQLLLQGVWEISGNLPLAANLATVQIILWALVRRVRLLAQDDERREAVPR